MNHIQKATLALGVPLLAFLIFFPPWQEAALGEVDFRKYVGRGFLFHPPQPVPVDCYFVGCITAPASYFHIVRYSELQMHQCITLFIVIAAIWGLCATRTEDSGPALQRWRTRLIFSVLFALAIPPTGDFPMSSLLLDIPRQIRNGGEGWVVIPLFTLFLFVICVAAVYCVTSVLLWIYKTRAHAATPS